MAPCRVLPANNVVGQHGKTAAFLGFDEIHGYASHNLFEALAPDPSAILSSDMDHQLRQPLR